MHHGTLHFAGGGQRCGFTPVRVQSVHKMLSSLEERETPRLISEADQASPLLTLLIPWAGSWAALQKCPENNNAAGGRSVAAGGRSVAAAGRSVAAAGRTVAAAGRIVTDAGRSVAAACRSVTDAGHH